MKLKVEGAVKGKEEQEPVERCGGGALRRGGLEGGEGALARAGEGTFSRIGARMEGGALVRNEEGGALGGTSAREGEGALARKEGGALALSCARNACRHTRGNFEGHVLGISKGLPQAF